MSQLPDYSPQSCFVGCYTKDAGGEGDGISTVHRDTRTGALGPTSGVVATPAPSFVVAHPRLPMLYAVNETSEGAVSAFDVAPEGDLSHRGSWPTGGSFPCHLGLDGAARHLIVANYGSGSVASFELDEAGLPVRESGRGQHTGAGADQRRQRGPHTHHVVPTADGVLAVDLGADSVFRYRRDPATGDLGESGVAAKLRPGTGPRGLVRDAHGVVHVVGELGATLTSFDPQGEEWLELGTIASSSSAQAQPSEIAVAPDGRFLYVANRGPDTLTVFAITGEMPQYVGEVPAGGAWPRHFAFVGDCLYVANERSHTVVAFRIDAATGMPIPTGDVLATPSPTCVTSFPAPIPARPQRRS